MATDFVATFGEEGVDWFISSLTVSDCICSYFLPVCKSSTECVNSVAECKPSNSQYLKKSLIRRQDILNNRPAVNLAAEIHPVVVDVYTKSRQIVKSNESFYVFEI